MSKIKKEQLEELQKINNLITEISNEISRNTITNHKLSHLHLQQEIRLNELKLELQEEHGKISIDLKTGEIEKLEEDEQADKKD
tara:strand:+ start:32 stop:283 length:252 start_codon:yes stop_codon:yes gene_type:complete